MRSSIDLSASSVFNTNAPRAQPGLQPFGHRRGRGLAHRAVGRVQPREAGFEGGGLAVELDRDRRDLLVEEALPRAAARHRLLGEHDLFGLGQQVRPVAAGRAQVVRGEREPFVGEERVDLVVGQLAPTRARRTAASCRSTVLRSSTFCMRAPRARGRSCRRRSRGRRSSRRGR